MKRFIISIFCLLAVVASGYMYMQQTNELVLVAKTQLTDNKESISKVEKKTQSFIGAFEYLMQMKANPETGRIDMADVINARQTADKAAESRTTKSAQIDWQFMGPNNVGGRTRAILADKDNPKRMVIGGVSGGIFTSDNGGLSWNDHPQNTELGTLSISAIAQAPNGDIYVGTGENFDGRSYGEGKLGNSVLPGNGIYKSTDRGVSFQLLESTQPTLTGSNLYNVDWAAIQDVEVSPTNANRVYASTSRGLQISQDGGATWAKAEGVPTTSVAYDVAVASDGTAHIVAGSKYYRANDGLNFEDGFTGTTSGQFEISSGNKVLSMSPTDNNYLYIVTVTSGGCLRKVWQTKNGGDTWIIIGEGSSNFFDPMSQGAGEGCQGWYDLCVTVDPANKERIIMGGITLWSWSARDSWNQLDGGAPPYSVHADKHTIVFHPTNPNIMFVGSDGGVARSLDAQNVFPTFSAINKNYIVTQFYGMAAGRDGRVVGGTQDNSTIFVTLDGSSVLEGAFITGGDGGFCDISKINPLAIFAESQNGAIVRTGSATPPLSAFFDENADCAPTTPEGGCNPDGQLDGNPLFITPFILWEDGIGNLIDPTQEKSLFVTGACDGRVWGTEGALNFSAIPDWKQLGKFAASRCISAVAVSNDGKTVYAGTNDGRMMRITNLDRDVPTTREFVVTGAQGQYIASIDVDFNPAHIIVGLGNYGQDQNIVESFNANSVNPTFTSMQHNLPLMPVYSVAIDEFNPNRIVAGTELGVWLYDAVSKTWTEENGIMGRVPVHSLRFEQMGNIGCNVLYAGTHGRGMYRSTNFTLLGCDTELAFPSYELPTVIEDLSDRISQIELFPNPMVAQSTLKITLLEATDLTLRIFDLQGRVVRNQPLGELAARTHSFDIEKGSLVAGTYIVMLNAGNKQVTKKLLVQ
ncbi:MAG: T9SS type A sorting domain-containing protein [Chitinophagales bacterium]